MTSYFENLFEATETDWQGVVDNIQSTVTEEHNDMMMKLVEYQEVKNELFHMHLDKSPGPDGMSPGFYQKYWTIVGKDITQLVQHYFDKGIMDDKVTETNIVLVPKKSNPLTMSDPRPISLCNVAYKIVFKVIANRLKEIIGLIISETQGAFIPGRLISDNIMVSHEVMYYMKRKTAGKQGWMALKLDMSKAYDRVEWDYLRAVLCKLGFNDYVVNLLLYCVTSARYSICHSGREFGNIVPSKGLRQGDPLSSYLFLIFTEGLSAILKQYEQSSLIGGIKVARGALTISHMLFADDSYIFCKASKEEASTVVNMLQVFKKASGQKINQNKSSVYFSGKVIVSLKQEICSRLGFAEADGNSHYLGLPSFIGRRKLAVLGYLKDKVMDRIKA